MKNENEEYQYQKSNKLGVLAGALIGGIAGAAAMLLFAPQSGEETRSKIQEKSLELRERTNTLMKDAVASVRSNADKLTDQGREKLEEIKQYGQEVAVEQLDRVSEAAKAGKKAIKSS